VQLHGGESPETCETLRQRGHRVIKAFRVADRVDRDLLERYRAASAILLDTHVPGVMGGTGQTFTWAVAEGLSADRRLIVAGGLDPDNVTAALDLLRPYAVDVTSGVEYAARDGRKDPGKVRAFVDAVRAWDARQAAPRSPAAPPRSG
jgi:phosphoribosylanthranilate isomerase